MPTGTVKWFNAEKGYGFIAEESGPDVFVHMHDLQASGLQGLDDDQRVEFEVTEGEHGLQAQSVRIV